MNAFKKFVSTLAIAALFVSMIPMSALAVTGDSDAPDLLIEDITVDTTTGLIAFTAANDGNTDADTTVDGYTEVYVDGGLVYEQAWLDLASTEQEFLASGGSHDFYPTVLTETHTVQVCIDTTDVVDEADEDNNCYEVVVEFEPATATVTVTTTSDSTVDAVTTDVSVGSTDLTSGNDASVSATVSGDDLTGAVDESVTTTESTDTDTDTDDGDTDVEEDTEEALPNLTITDIYLSDEGYLSVRVENTSTVDISEDTDGTLYIYIDDMNDPEWTYNWGSLDQKEFLTAGDWSVIQPQALEDGTVKAVIDATDVVEESDEDDNEMTVVFASEGLYISEAGIESDDDTSFYAKVCNAADAYTEDLTITFEANGYENELTASALADGDCRTLYSWGFSVFGVEDDVTYDLDVTVTDGDETDTYSTEVTIPEDDLDDDAVDEYVVEEDSVEDDVDDVEDEDLDEDVSWEFDELWTDSDYPDTLYLSVRWGYFGDDDVETTDWDGSVNFEGAVLGRPQQLLAFEDEDWIDFSATNPTMTSFQSVIYNGSDGLLFKLKADLEAAGDSEPFIEFNSDYENTSWEVWLTDLLDDEDSQVELEYADDYKVIIDLVTYEEWMERFEDTVLLQVRVGNLNGAGSEQDDAHLYSVELETSDGSLVRGYMPVLLEEHQDEYSGYDQLTRGSDKTTLTLGAGIFGHQDGFLALLDVIDSEEGERSITVTVTDDVTGDVLFEQTFTQDDELGVFDLDDGTGNQIAIENMFRYKTHLLGDADSIFAAMYSWQHQLYRLASVIEDLIDTGELDDDLVDDLYALMDDLLAVVPGEDSDTILGETHKHLVLATSALNLKLQAYNDLELTGDELNEWVRDILDRTVDTISEDLDELAETSGTMKDVDYEAWYSRYMDSAILFGFFGGYKDAAGNPLWMIGPADSLTRFQLIKIMSELSYELEMGLGETACDPAVVTLTDDTAWMGDHWARGYVQCIEDSGIELTLLDDVISEDVDEGTSAALRWEVVALGFEILGASSQEYDAYTLGDLESAGLSEDFSDFIQTAVDLGIVSGYPDGNYRPFGQVNRAEMFKIVTLFYEVFSQTSST